MDDWYMQKKVPNITSLFINDEISEYAQNNFADVLMTDYADAVDLYDHSLTKIGIVRCIIQGNSHNTYIGTIDRTGLFEIGIVKAGMYIYFDNNWWLITGRPANNKVYEKVTLKMCQYDLKWQNSNGVILHRPCHIMSASKYDIGVDEKEKVILPSNNYIVLITSDKDTYCLDNKRVFIDNDLSTSPFKAFTFTRNDDVLYQYGYKGGILSFITDRTLYNPETDNLELGICDYVNPEDIQTDTNGNKVNNIITEIKGKRNIKIGYPRKYTVVFTDGNGEEYTNDDIAFEWNVVCDCDVSTNINGKTLTVSVDDYNSAGSVVTIQVKSEGMVIDEIKAIIEKGY